MNEIISASPSSMTATNENNASQLELERLLLFLRFAMRNIPPQKIISDCGCPV